MKNLVRTFALAATLAGTIPTTAAAQLDEPAQRSNTAGFSLGVYLNGSAIQLENSDVTESGGGGSVHLGYGATRNTSLFIRANGARMEAVGVDESYTMAHVDLGARYSFGKPTSFLRPFVQGAAGGRALAMDLGSETVYVRGPLVSAGAGAEFFFTRDVALEMGLTYSLGQFRQGRLSGEEWESLKGENAVRATSARFDIGVSYHP